MAETPPSSQWSLCAGESLNKSWSGPECRVACSLRTGLQSKRLRRRSGDWNVESFPLHSSHPRSNCTGRKPGFVGSEQTERVESHVRTVRSAREWKQAGSAYLEQEGDGGSLVLGGTDRDKKNSTGIFLVHIALETRVLAERDSSLAAVDDDGVFLWEVDHLPGLFHRLQFNKCLEMRATGVSIRPASFSE